MNNIIKGAFCLISMFVSLSAWARFDERFDSLMRHAAYDEIRTEYEILDKADLPKSEPERSDCNAMLLRLAVRLGLHEKARHHYAGINIEATGDLPRKENIINAVTAYMQMSEYVYELCDLRTTEDRVIATYGKSCVQLPEFVFELGWMDSYVRNYGTAIEKFEKTKTEAVAQGKHSLAIDAMLQIVSALTEGAQFEEAMARLKEAEAYVAAKTGEKSVYRVQALRLRAMLALYLGDVENSEKCMREAGLMLEKNGEYGSFEYALCLRDMGYAKLGVLKGNDARIYFTKLEELQRKKFGANSNPVYVAVTNMADAALFNQDYKELKSLEDIADEIDINLKNNPLMVLDMVHFTNTIAEGRRRQGYPSVAVEYLKTNIDVLKDLDANNVGEFFNTYNALGLSYLNADRPDEAVAAFSKQLVLHRKVVHDVFLFLPEAQRGMYADRMSNLFNRMMLVNRDGAVSMGDGTVSMVKGGVGGDSTAELLFDAALLSKGMQLQAVVNLRRILAASGNENLKRMSDELTQLRRRGALDGSLSAADEKRAVELETRLIMDSRQYGDFMHFANVSWKDVAARLKKDEVAIEFVVSEDNGREYYSAEILRKGDKAPKHQFLFSIKKSSKLFHKEDIYLSQTLYEKVWKRILPDIKKNSTIYFAPAGKLYGVAVENALLKDGVRMSDIYKPVRLSSTRELMSEYASAEGSVSVLYGGLDYDTSIDEMELLAEASSERVSYRGAACGSGKRGAWEYLPGTLAEVNAISHHIAGRHGGSKSGAVEGISLFTGKEGTEESFKQLSGSAPRTIHLATHGFFLDGGSASNSLRRSALMLSGGNNGWLFPELIPEGVEDGVLTAKEISELDFSGTELVVMSACQTGLGQVTGEGVFGLQRAFKLAGAKTLVMSLAPVHDDATRVLMTEFYAGLSCGLSVREAFQKGQQAVKKGVFEVDGVPIPGADPRFWASFVVMD